MARTKSCSEIEDQQQFGYTLDEGLSAIGFGKFQYFVLAYAGLGWLAEAMESTLLSFLGSGVQSEWGISPRQQSLISTVTLIGMLVGGYAWGKAADSYGRRKGFLGAAIIAIATGVLSVFAPNYVSLLILRGLSGVGLGCGHVFATWLLEFVPTPDRGKKMVAYSSFWTLGSIMETSLAWWIMPKYGWRWLVGLSAIPYILVLLFYRLVTESPRFLCTQEKLIKARDILKNMAKCNNKKLPQGLLVTNQIKQIANESGAIENIEYAPLYTNEPTINISLWDLFLVPVYKRTTLLLWVLYFANTFSYYGIVLLTSQLSQCMMQPQIEMDEDSLYVNVLITSFADLPGLALAAFTLDKIGRKPFMKIMITLAFFLLSPLVIHQTPTLTTILLFGARMFNSSSFTTVCIYAQEVYPTNLRARGVGIAMGVGRFGGILCPLVAVAMGSGCQHTLPVILFEVTILVQGLCVVFLPIETKGRNVDDYIDSRGQPQQLA